ncbi:hypothetical protein M8C13_06835 [Crossiella sp. SN42]|uniref:hypothetical protein n=1 Tax=Crossiella sp. SN42 TaxID=2944808 RepID=UPI00207C66C1|nr:hypothetical protein [Crossiella sp. SN42]MCO1575472.1 hypothetical protein [Crossiella sp. SN42]
MVWIQGADDNTWKVRYKRPDNQYIVESGFSSAEEARAHGEHQEHLIAQGTWVDPQGSPMLFLDWAWRCFTEAEKKLAPATRGKYHRYIDTIFASAWAGWTLAQLDRNERAVGTWWEGLSEKYTRATANAVFFYFSRLLNQAEIDGHIQHNPCHRIIQHCTLPISSRRSPGPHETPPEPGSAPESAP